MKILFIGTTCPFGDISGAGLRTRNLLRLLGNAGDVTPVFATAREWTPEQLEQTRDRFGLALHTRYQHAPLRGLRDRWRKVFDPRFLNPNTVIVPEADRRRVEELAASHDVVWVHTLKLADAFRRFHWPHSILDVDDFPSRFHRSAIRHAPGMRAKLMRCQKAFSWRRHEKLCHERFDLLTVCKEADRTAFGDPARVHVIPNGFEAPPASSVPRRGDRIGMIGDFNYLPNHDGLKWFMREAWDSIRRQVPGVELRLVGKGSAEVAAKHPGANVNGLGYVPDVAEETGTWSCMIVPTRLGGGTHLKVAEGLARRIPIVTTCHGARGYRLTNGHDSFIADEPAGFSRGCVQLLRHADLRDRISEAGWELFRNHYSWDSIQPAVARVLEDCLARRC
jgi:glycosyltransferase involved in cell wall biosynthesis